MAQKSIYVGNLPFSATDNEIGSLFDPYGEVLGVKIIIDRETGRPKGFAFVEMEADAADEAIRKVNGTEMKGRLLKVSEGHHRAR